MFHVDSSSLPTLPPPALSSSSQWLFLCYLDILHKCFDSECEFGWSHDNSTNTCFVSLATAQSREDAQATCQNITGNKVHINWFHYGYVHNRKKSSAIWSKYMYMYIYLTTELQILLMILIGGSNL